MKMPPSLVAVSLMASARMSLAAMRLYGSTPAAFADLTCSRAMFKAFSVILPGK
jgi:hypothetical protein